MRLFTFLMLFLGATSLSAQLNCQIFDLTATVVDSSDCHYYVVLDFEHMGTSDQFVVQGNGVNYGTFSYGDLPLWLGPFTGSPNGLVEKEFAVRDFIFQDCQDVVTATIPACQTGACEVFNLTVEAFDCNPDAGTYHLLLDFDVVNPGNDFFEVYAANGAYLGIFPLNQLPLVIPNFPWNGQDVDVVKVCINDQPNCCRVKEFEAPDCVGGGDCGYTNFQIETGPCFPDSTYTVVINFQSLLANPLADTFSVYTNGIFYGTFPLSQLPLTIEHFPWNGGAFDVIKICRELPNSTAPCCVEKEFHVPPCIPSEPCSILNLVVDPGDCTSDSTYSAFINFQVVSPDLVDSFELAINGQFYGVFGLDQLPLQLDSVQWNGLIFNYVRICTGNAPSCCREFQYLVPGCLPFGDCAVTNVFVQTQHCTSDSTYQVRVGFNATNPGNGTFLVYANGVLVDTFSILDAPVTIANFPWSGDNQDVVTVCVGGNDVAPCCLEKPFAPPACILPGDCEIHDLVVDPGGCTSDSTYALVVNFIPVNAPGDQFGLWANGEFFGTFNFGQLPLTIPNFPWNGGPNDFVKICLFNGPGAAAACCLIAEFPVPDCLGTGGDCDIFDLVVDPTNCTGDSTYNLIVNFQVENPMSDQFQLYGNGQLIGTFGLNQLPLHLEDFHWNGGPNDVIKVCIGPNTVLSCCAIIEFPVPDCLGAGGDCDIFDFVVDPGTCTGDSTYLLFLNFEVSNPSSNVFVVYANGQPFGTFNLSQLPLTIEHFPWNGGNNDVVKVCMSSNMGTVSDCCAILEFEVPDCLGGGDCDIVGLVVDPGDCTGDSTYNLTVNFEVENPTSDHFQLYGNGQLIGTFALNQLPLHLEDFQWNGGPNDVIKVCIGNNTTLGCCETIEFAVPDCLGAGPDCHIFDVHVVATPCLCGQFFALVSFEFDGGGSAGFDIVGNGTNYGNFPYNHPQPVILGPLAGNGTTPYEFEVRDHDNPDCFDFAGLGVVNCQSPVQEPSLGTSLALTPNPASDRLSVSSQWPSGAQAGAATAEVYHADGRLMQTVHVGNGTSFQLDVEALPAGVYRLVLLAEAGRVEGSFVKQ
jgi:hypothetical protein